LLTDHVFSMSNPIKETHRRGHEQNLTCVQL
jgi:hypothetical protein